jgi:putative endonuclease
MSRAAGDRAEDHALAFLEARGLRLVARNVALRVGEIDLVMRDRQTIVFVEVRQRRGGGVVSPEESVSVTKRQRLARAAGAFLARHEALAESPARFDVVAIQTRGNNNEVTWIRNAFAPDGSW